MKKLLIIVWILIIPCVMAINYTEFNNTEMEDYPCKIKFTPEILQVDTIPKTYNITVTTSQDMFSIEKISFVDEKPDTIPKLAKHFGYEYKHHQCGKQCQITIISDFIEQEREIQPNTAVGMKISSKECEDIYFPIIINKQKKKIIPLNWLTILITISIIGLILAIFYFDESEVRIKHKTSRVIEWLLLTFIVSGIAIILIRMYG